MFTVAAQGIIGRNPQIKPVKDNQVASFSLAVKTGKDETTWIECSIWGTRADVAMRFLQKGQRIAVAGRAKTRSYVNKDGVPGFSVDLEVFDFSLPPRSDAAPAEDVF